MDYTFLNFLSLLGAVGLFLYGMKVMSEGLQKAAGGKLRDILSAMTRNKWVGMLTGVTITALIQSSSASTVMVVSFVNAGLMTLQQSVAVIMGANVGSTFTTWVVTFFGFSVSLTKYLLPLLAIAVPLMFTKKSKWKSISEFLIGFVFLFYGLEFIQDNVPDLSKSPELFAALKNYTEMGYLSVLLFFLVGMVVTMVIQSSAATIAIVLIMSTKGWIPFDMACAIVLGSNVGTTVTPLLASLGGNASAKKAAGVHLLFNLIGTVWMVPVFFLFVKLAAIVTESLGFGDPTALYASADAAGEAQLVKMRAATSWGLTVYHTMYNTCNLLLLLGFTGLMVKIVDYFIKTKPTDDSESQLKYISAGLVGAAELNILQAQRETVVMAQRVERMFGMVKTLVHTKLGTKEFDELLERIYKYEDISDRMEIEIANYLNQVMDGRLSHASKMRIATLLNIVSELESIADSCNNIAKTFVRKMQSDAHFVEYNYKNIDLMLKYVSQAMTNMMGILVDVDGANFDDLRRSYEKEREINEFRNHCRSANVENINNKKYPYEAGILYMDIICEAEKLADYIVNVVDSVEELLKRNTEEDAGVLLPELNPEKIK